ncbi:hypothetical protein ACG94X_14055 [Acinetobacter sp. ULE_I010]|uniref:hypothetical protein n=1 Tax=Acinetobacter sp. ULE_I010 TaxID=3373065 RepID=UPI003AF61C4D
MASPLQRQVYQAYLNAGLSSNQSRIITAEVGREGSFDPKNIFGVHSDPKNKATNLGMLSWQGDRGRALQGILQSQGLIRGNSILPTQDSLNAMARFSVNEMRTNKTYNKTAQAFLNNPNVDYQTGAAALGRNYIRWRYDDPVYKSGHVNRDKFYQAMGGQVGNGGQSQVQQPQEVRYLSNDQVSKLFPKAAQQTTSQPQYLNSTDVSRLFPKQNNQPQYLSAEQVTQLFPKGG